MLGFEIVQIGLPLKSHDPLPRTSGFRTFARGKIMIFAREILDLIMGQLCLSAENQT